jgi:glycine/D-amino acid oxidase-like deaminating enzyme
MRTDVVVIGGGVMGSALAYWLTHLDPTASVTVIERDPSYASASSALSAASIRQQFSTAVNVRISQHSIELLRGAHEWLAVEGESPDLRLNEGGYLYLAGQGGLAALEAAHAVQRELGADVVLLTRPELRQRFPWLSVDDLAAGSLGLSGEGWFDGYALLTGLARKARHQGARYVRGEVTGIDVANHRVTTLTLADGTRLTCGSVVNAAGAWAGRVAALAGIDLPVYPRRRTVFVISCPIALASCPLLIDRTGFWMRPDGPHFIAGAAPRAGEESGDFAPLEPELELFESDLWPALAARIPAFEAARVERAWAGYYEYNTFDQNGILGLHPSLDNFVLMNGFSGHGFQQAPVVGRAIAELLLTGRYVTLDLSDLGIGRLLDERPLRELNIIG